MENAHWDVFPAQFLAGGNSTKPADDGKIGCFSNYQGRIQQSFMRNGSQQVIHTCSGRDAKDIVSCIYSAQGYRF
jgi:hypothetical protein